MFAHALHPDVDRYQLGLYLGMAAGIILTVVSLLGEFLGWRNDWGLAGTIMGVVLTGVMGAATLLLGSARRQAVVIASGVVANHTETRAVRGEIHELRGETRGVRAEIHDLRGEVREGNGRLEAGQERQTEVLRDIRDRLPPGGGAPQP